MVKKKCKVVEGEVLCPVDEKDEPEEKEVKETKETKKKTSKCTTLIDPNSKEQVEVCTTDGKPVTARQIAGVYGTQTEED
jgi:hypothetical protein